MRSIAASSNRRELSSMNRFSPNHAVAALFGGVLVVAVATAAQDPAPKKDASPAEAAPKKVGAGPLGGLDLVKGLKETPGCLGVETARTSSGKNVIFAWFEGKEAVIDWYE